MEINDRVLESIKSWISIWDDQSPKLSKKDFDSLVDEEGYQLDRLCYQTYSKPGSEVIDQYKQNGWI